MRRAAAALLLSLATTRGAGAALEVEAWLPPAQAPAAQANLVAREGDALYASWVERDGDGHRLRFARSDGRTFAPPRTIARGTHWFVNWADFPALVPLGGRALAAYWLERNGEGTYAYGVRIVRSDDDGETWSAPRTPHDASPTEHGFVALWPRERGALGMAWLDGRETGGGHGDGGHDAHGGAMTLRAAELDATLATQREWPIDVRTCDCCQTDAALVRNGPLLVYRGRDAGEVRDIHVVRRTARGWSTPRRVHADGWTTPACPVNGPAIGARDDEVRVAWYTATGDVPRVRLARSRDGGRSFEAPLDLATGNALGRVDVALSADGATWTTWLEQDERMQRLWLARHDAALAHDERTLLVELPRGRATGFPRIAASGDALYAIWTEGGDGATRIAGARVRHVAGTDD